MMTKGLIAAGSLALAFLAAVPAQSQTPARPSCAAVPSAAQNSGVSIAGATACGIVSANTGAFAYEGIPYATQQRWQNSSPTTPSGVINATAFGPVCPQPNPNGNLNMSEDCLFLNVWTPTWAGPSSNLPVMVFIHGGAFVEGAGSSGLYDGSTLAMQAAANAKGAVVVTLNYRLGALGFLVANSRGVSTNGNFGLHDQQLAMAWVKNYIVNFGGNPGQITLFGESAGAMSVGLHTFDIPTSQGLFTSALMESNPAGIVYRQPQASQQFGNQFLTYLCNNQNPMLPIVPTATKRAAKAPARAKPAAKGIFSKCTGNWAANVSVPAILNAQFAFITVDHGANVFLDLLDGGFGLQSLPWQPVFDGSFVDGEPFDGYNGNVTSRVPVAFGTNQNEGVIFIAMAYLKSPGDFTPINYAAFLVDRFGVAGMQKVLAIPRYAPSGQTLPLGATYENQTSAAFANLATDYIFNCGNVTIANAIMQQSAKPVYAYHFAQSPFFDLYNIQFKTPSPDGGGCAPTPNANVCHAEELPYVFSTFSFITDASSGNYKPQPSDTSVTQGMNAAWFNFAASPSAPTNTAAWSQYNQGSAALWQGSATPTPMNLDQQAMCSAFWSSMGPYKNAVQPLQAKASATAPKKMPAAKKH